MKVMARKNYDVPEFMDNQVFKGFCSTAQSYTFTVTGNEFSDEYSVTGTIYDMQTVTSRDTGELVDVRMVIYPTWKEDGPLNVMSEVLVSDIKSYEQVYLQFKPLYKPAHKDTGDLPVFVFRFSNTDLPVTPIDLVKVSYHETRTKLKKGEDDRRSVYAYVTDIRDDFIYLKAVASYKGLYDIENIVLPLSTVYAVFRYYVDISTFVHKERAIVQEEKVPGIVVESADCVPNVSE